MLQLVLQLQDCFVYVLAARGTPTATHIQIPCRCAELVAIPFKMLLAQHILTARPLQLAVLFFGFFLSWCFFVLCCFVNFLCDVGSPASTPLMPVVLRQRDRLSIGFKPTLVDFSFIFIYYLL
jgi:hypothetical protein